MRRLLSIESRLGPSHRFRRLLPPMIRHRHRHDSPFRSNRLLPFHRFLHSFPPFRRLKCHRHRHHPNTKCLNLCNCLRLRRRLRRLCYRFRLNLPQHYRRRRRLMKQHLCRLCCPRPIRLHRLLDQYRFRHRPNRQLVQLNYLLRLRHRHLPS